MKLSNNMLQLYAITDRGDAAWQTLYEQAEKALKGGVTIVQLREKGTAEDELIAEAMKIKELCHHYDAPLIINDNVSVALKCGADGVHVGIEDDSVEYIRSIAPDGFIVGATAKTAEQAKSAERAGADYLGVGAVFPSATKIDTVRITDKMLEEICSSVSIPVVAIGGIGIENIWELEGCGITGVAAVSAIFSADDIMEAASELKRAAGEIINK